MVRHHPNRSLGWFRGGSESVVFHAFGRCPSSGQMTTSSTAPSFSAALADVRRRLEFLDRIAGPGARTLIAGLSDPRLRASRSNALSAVQRLTKHLTPGGLQCLQLLFQALNQQKLTSVVELVTWMRGEPVPTIWRRRNGLPARA